MKAKVFLGCLFLSVFLASCEREPQTIKVTGITLNTSSLSLTEGETADLTATISPKDADNKTVLWSSSNGSVASVDNGRVSALLPGTTTITAKSDDGGFTASCSVTVAPRVIAVTSVSLSKTELTLVEGDSETLTASVIPDDATDKTVTWSSSNEAVATVKDGIVTAIKEGEATVSAKAGDVTSSCKVSVSKRVIAVESIELDKAKLVLVEGESETLTATVLPDNATDKAVSWSSSDPSIATVEEGKVCAIKKGETTIIAKAGSQSVTCNVTVNEAQLYLEQNDYSLNWRGGTFILKIYSNIDFCIENETEWIEVVSQESTKDENTGLLVTDFSVSYLENLDDEREGRIVIKWMKKEGQIQNIVLIHQDLCTINVGSDGEIQAILSNEQKQEITAIRLYGELSDRDYYEIRQMPKLLYLDLFNTTNTELKNSLLSELKLETVILPSQLTYIPKSLCEKSRGLKRVVIPETVVSIGENAFLYCALEGELVLSNNVSYIGSHCFQENKLTSIIIGSSLETIPVMAFAYNRKLTTVKLGDSIKSIGASAFNSCDALAGIIEFPEGTEYIGSGAFTSYYALEGITGFRCLSKIPPTIESDAIANFDYLQVPKGCLNAYRSAAVWSDFLVIEEIQ